MIKLLRSVFGLFSVLIVVSSAVRVLGWVYGALTPEPLPYSESQRHAVQETSQRVQAWASTLTVGHQTAVFGNLAHDPFGFVSGPIHDALWRSGRFDLLPRGFWERLRARMGWTEPCWPAGPSLVDYGRARGAELAIGGAVVNLADNPKPALDVRLEIVEVATGRPLAVKDFVLETSTIGRLLNRPASPGYPSRDDILLWLAIILILPLGVLPFARPLLVEGSNAAILLTFFGLVAFDVFSAYLLYAGQCAGWLGAGLIVALSALCLALNYRYLVFLKELAL